MQKFTNTRETKLMSHSLIHSFIVYSLEFVAMAAFFPDIFSIVGGVWGRGVPSFIIIKKIVVHSNKAI